MQRLFGDDDVGGGLGEEDESVGRVGEVLSRGVPVSHIKQLNLKQAHTK